MHEWWTLAPAPVAGMLLGAAFFGGLWWTVRQGVLSPRPAAWFLGSVLVRTRILLAGFYYVSGGHGDRLLACLLGFVIARFFLMWLIGPSAEHRQSTAKEVGHAA